MQTTGVAIPTSIGQEVAAGQFRRASTQRRSIAPYLLLRHVDLHVHLFPVADLQAITLAFQTAPARSAVAGRIRW